ncbi:hypothetical protein SKAU_G00272260 [Synaphobranchus kaupii]|uniref:DUF4476 domain-containing protein n=1 Tax=Synaphobranchus kaupii TaxID=118154 RepID=A0A9Q1F0H3_SYNKA|nr:hypothetical protein SKAU_G00272260 [Synaphobranchus kaupii]
MDKKSFDIVLDEIRKCVLTDQRIKAIEHVHGYFSSEQVTEMLKYFSWAEPQIKAVKAMQHKMVAIPTTKVANILNCFTFSKDKLIVLELIALNISDAHNYRPVEDLFRIHVSDKKRCRRILEQVCKVGCKAPVAMVSSCGMIPGNPYPKGKPSQVTGTFPGTPVKKDGEEANAEGKGIAARIIGPFKPSPSTYNPHRPVPYPIPPCRPHATIAPSAYNNAGLVSVGGVITANVPPPPYSATLNSAAFSRPASQQNHTATPTIPPPTTPITPVFPGLVPSQNLVVSSPSVIKGGPPMASASGTVTQTASGHSTPVPLQFSGLPPSVTPTPSVIKSHTPSGTPCGTPVPSGGYSPSPYSSLSRSGTPSGVPTPASRSAADSSMGLPPHKGYPSSDTQTGSPYPGLPPLAASPAQSVIRSYTPSGPPPLTPGLPAFAGLPPGSTSATQSPKPSALASQAQMGNAGPFYGEQHMGSLSRHGSGSNSPVPSAFKGPSRSGTPSLSSLVIPNSAALARSLGLSHPTGSPQASLPSPAAMAGLQGLSGSPTPHSLAAAAFPGLGPFPSLSSASPFPGAPPGSISSAASVSAAPPTSVPGFPGFGGSGPPAAGSPVLSSFMGLPGATSSVATVAPLQAAAVAAAAAGISSSAPVLPGFASAFSSNFNPALVAQAGLTGGLQPPGGAAFPGLLSFPAMPGFSPASASPAALSGLHNPAVQSALLQAHSASALENYPPQPNGFTNYPPAPGTPFALQPGLHPQLGWQ